MARLTAPLFSVAAHGSIGSELTFSQRKTVNQVRFQHKQKDYVNTARTAQREKFQDASEWWGLMSPADQALFDGFDERDA